MADNLPDPESRVESYLAKAAGEDVTIPEKPLSRLEQYLDAIAEGGGGGGTSDFDELTNRPKYNGTVMTGETNIPASPTVVQEAGNSQTDVMSQNAATGMVYSDPANQARVRIGYGATASSNGTVAIGGSAKASSSGSIAIGKNTRAERGNNITIGSGANAYQASEGNEIAIGNSAGSLGSSDSGYATSVGYYASAKGNSSIAIGRTAQATAQANNGVAIGYGAQATQKGQFDISTGSSSSGGYNNTGYRLLTGLYPPQSAHDAATKGYVDGLLSNLGAAKELTTDDYNWNRDQDDEVEPFDSIATWKLDPGLYYVEEGVLVCLDRSNPSGNAALMFAVTPQQPTTGQYGDGIALATYVFYPTGGISLYRSYYNMFVQDDWGAGASTYFPNGDEMSEAIRRQIETTYVARPDDTTWGEAGKMLIYIDTSTTPYTPEVYVCGGQYEDPDTHELKYSWTQW